MHIPAPIRVGTHEVQISGKVVRLNVIGDFTAADVGLYAGYVDAAIVAGQPYVVFADLGDLKSIGPESRRRIISWHKKHHCERCAILGAKPFIRAIVSLLVRGMSLVAGIHINLRFFSTVEEATAWVDDWVGGNDP